MTDLSPQILTGLLFATGMAITAYPSFAEQQGWRIGSWARSSSSWTNVIGLAMYLHAFGYGYLRTGLIALAVSCLAGAALSAVATVILKEFVQYWFVVSPVLLVLVWI